MKLAPKLTILFLLLAIVPTAIVGYLAYENGQRTIVQETIDHLVSINIFKSNELKRWVEDNKNNLEQMAQRPLIWQYAAVLAKHVNSDPAYRKAKGGIVEDHLKPRLKYGGFLELFVMGPHHGQISASTNEKQEGKYRDTYSYFIEGKSHTHIQGIYYSPALEQPAMTIGTPIRDKQGNLLGVLAGRLDLGELSKIIVLQSGNSPTEDTYLVNTFNFFVTEPRFGQGYALKKAIRTEGVEAGLSGKDGVGFYKDYRGVPVIGAYKWLPESNMCILTEIDQAEAFAPIVHLAWVITGIASASSILAGFLGVFFARTITRPVRQLAAGAEEIGRGNLEHRVGRASKDEIGGLSRAFDRMTENLKATMVSRDELALSEERYRTTMMSVGDGVIATDTEGRVELLNPVAEALTGWRQEEARGKPLEEVFRIINEETRQTVENPVRRVIREGLVVGLANHSVLIAKDDTEHPIADSGAPIRDEKGEITGVVLVFRDQTQERAAQKALKESERKFRDTVRSLDEGYYSATADGLLLEHNPAFSRILGIDIAQDLKGAKLPDFWQNPDDRKEYLNELKTKGFVRNYLINVKSVSGEKMVVMSNAHLIKDENGRMVRIEGTFTDFTERKRAEEKLRESEARLNAVMQGSPIPKFVIDMNHRVIYWNKALEELSGIRASEVVGTTQQWKAFYPLERPVMADLLVDGAIEEIPRWYEGKFKAWKLIDGAYEATDFFPKLGEAGEWLDLTSAPIRDAHGTVIGAVETLENITDRKRAEEEIRRLNESLEQRVVERTAQLEAANKEMEAFAYSVSHDLRAPLRAVDGYTRILLEDHAGHLNEDAQRTCGHIREGAQRMGKLIDDLLAFSRLGRAEMQASSIDMQRLANSVFFELTTLENRDSLDFRLQSLSRAEGDPTMVRQIWMNLISNALKFSSKREQPVIEIGCHEEAKETIYYVRDNGAGFDMQYSHKLFGVFQRLHSTREFEGTGVGLAIVRRIVQRHGGRTWAEGETERGATFYFSLPRK